jgi:release factor glutamine methyltransferase
MTAAALLREAEQALRGAGIDSAAWDAERLLRHVLQWDRAAVLTRSAEKVAPDAQARLRDLVARRARRIPLQQLVGTQAFWRHEFLVTPDVLVPRPETELLVETALARLRGSERPVLVDVGTGSGCIALSLALERPDAEVHATEISGAALAVARENARRLGAASRVAFHEGDLLAPVSALAGRIALVVSNPPYVAEAERDALAPEVRDHEPALALFAGNDGLAVYRRLLPAAAAVLRPGGLLALEIGLGQADAVTRLCREAGLAVETVAADLQGIARVVVARAGLA